jgi:nucleotidyltransferase substrate binding protein (TIGR01987 family)
MIPAPIDFQPLQKALSQLNEAITFWQDRAEGDPLKPHLRSAVIQSFEFTYELALRTVRRVLVERSASADLIRDLSFSDLLRSALDAGLPTDLTAWRRWRDLRNSTSHTYDEERAQAVVIEVPEFAAQVSVLLASLTLLVTGGD